MELFHAIPIDRGDETIRAALTATINRARQHHLTTAGWSLAELHLDEGDAQWLNEWARALDDQTARRWLLPEPTDAGTTLNASSGAPLKLLPVRRAAIGVLLFLLTAEQARRRMAGADDWWVAPSTYFNDPIRKLLFDDGQPTELYINSLMQASERLHLRQNGGWSSPASDYENIALQIALTAADLKERWPQWLRGASPPEHIARLLDLQTGSHSFQQLWQDCCDYLESALSEAELITALTRSPWVLPQWIEVIVTSLKPHRVQIARLMDAELPSVPLPAEFLSSQSPQSVLLPAEVFSFAEPSGFEPVRQSKPLVRPDLGDIFDGLTPYGGVKTIIRATRAILARADKLNLRGGAWSLAELRPSEGDYLWLRVWVKRLEVLTVWFGTETERRFNIGCKEDEEYIGYRAGLGCLLLLWLSETARRDADENDPWRTLNPDDFEPPVAAELFRKNQPSRFLREALAAAVRELNLRHALDDSARCWSDTVFLQFGFARAEFVRNLPQWLAGRATTRALGGLLNQETGSRSFRMLWQALRDFGQGEIAEDTLRDLIAVNAWILPEWQDEIVFAARNEPAAEQRDGVTVPEPPIETIGAARWTAGGWQVLTGNEILTVEQARTSRFRIITPPKRDYRGKWVRWAVMEGGEMVTRWEDGDQLLSSLNGLGAPLTVKSGPFDNPNDEFWIAAEVVDHGLIEDVMCESLADGAAKSLRLKVAGRAEPSDRHFVVWWDENGEVGKLEADYCDDAEDGWWWICKVPEAAGGFIALAIAHGGFCSGAWWPEDWAGRLVPVIEHEPLLAAALVRWLRLPVLSRKASAVIARGSRKFAPAFLAAWLKDYGLPEWLRFEQSDERWLAAVRAIFHQWWPDPDSASRVLMTLANAVTVDELNVNLVEVARMLCRVDPLLLASILKVGKEHVLIGSPSELRLQLAGSQTKPEYFERRQGLLEECVEKLGVDRNVVQAGLLDCAVRWLGGYELHRHEECNLAFALRYESARLLLALHLLERV
jgi:hypothetical protein